MHRCLAFILGAMLAAGPLPVTGAMNSKAWVAVARAESFQDRVLLSLIRVAVSVYSESLATQCHAERVAYAERVLKGEIPLLFASMAVMTNIDLRLAANVEDPSGLHNIKDPALDSSVDSIFDALAGCDKSTYQQIIFQWDHSISQQTTGYRLYQGQEPGVYDFSWVTDYVDTTIYYVPRGEWYFAATAFDAEGNESGYSNEVHFTW